MIVALALSLLAGSGSASASKVLIFGTPGGPTRPPTPPGEPACAGPLDAKSFATLSERRARSRLTESRAQADMFIHLALPDGRPNPTIKITRFSPTERLKTPTGDVLVSDLRAGDDVLVYDLGRLGVTTTRVTRVERIDDEHFELTIDE